MCVYIRVSQLHIVLTSASYTIALALQCPSRGQLFGIRQLQGISVSCVIVLLNLLFMFGIALYLVLTYILIGI